MVNQIFISYRRADSAGVTGRIYDRLVQKFGKEAIFKDVDSIPLGVNFRQYIDSVVKECDMVLVVIGDRWIEEMVEEGKRRLDDPRDFVRIEIESALQRNIPVIPLLVQQAAMPAEESLPTTLKELAYRNGMAIGHDPHFHTDVDRLIKNLENYFAILSKTKYKTPNQEPIQHHEHEKLSSSDSQKTDPGGSMSPVATLSSMDKGKDIARSGDQIMSNPIKGACEVCGRKINWFDSKLGGVKRCRQHLKT